MKLLFATRNQGKLAELRALAPPSIEVVSLDEVSAPETVEDGATFEANARKKAVEACQATGLAALADDSGLCVDALGGRPGVYSARYAPGDDRSRIDKLLGELRDVPDERRGAAFRCVLCLALPSGKTVVVEGECRGRIGRSPRGNQGFGYDPVFVLDDRRTMAELTRDEKSAISHRGRAFRAMQHHLEALARGLPAKDR